MDNERRRKKARIFAVPLAALALLLVSACGGGSHAVPPMAKQPAPGAPAPALATSALTFGVPMTAQSGVRFIVHLPLRNSGELDTLIANQSTKNSPLYHHYLTPDQFRAQYGPTESDLRAAAASLQNAGMRVNFTSQGVGATGSLAAVQRYFNTTLRQVQSSRGGAMMLQSTTALRVPQELQKLGAIVSPFAKLVVQPHSVKLAAITNPDNRYAPNGPYWFDDLKQAYSYPSYLRATGAGHTIAVVMASDYNPSDLANYFTHEKLAVPNIVRRPVDGGAGFDPNSGASFEDELDIEQSGGMAPGATIMNYDMPDLSVVPSTLDAYTAIVDDDQADIVNSSFGLCELYFTAAYNGTDVTSLMTQTFHDVFKQGNAQGITWVNASGDNGALGCLDPTGSTYVLGVEWPSNDPLVTAVGGTNLITTFTPGSRNSKYVTENAFSDPLDPAQTGAVGGIWASGGGISTIFSKPAYQYFVNTGAAKRTVPDLAGHMGGCPSDALAPPCSASRTDRSADIEAFAGGFYGVVGTSASSPDFAGLLALKEQTLGTRLGNENYDAYLLGAANFSDTFYHSRIPGNNGYPTKPGYNYVLGLGTVIGNTYAFSPFASAGTPQTPSNP